MINDDEAALVAPSPAVEGKTDMVCVDLKTSFESHNLAVTQEFLGLSFTVEEVFHSKKHKVIAATWGCNTTGDCAWNLSLRVSSLESCECALRTVCLCVRRITQQPPHHPVLLHTSEDHLPDNLAKVDNTHFACCNRRNHTLSVFSTDDFDHPLRVFPLSQLPL
ncbi:hypothetical protein Pelo_18620 [Pelomyxa schiedti]|nr:hypothetical protein Pelo_18620 [Pelomyxa schiedti]